MVDHVYYTNYMYTDEQLPTDAVRCSDLPRGTQVASAPGAPDGSGHVEQNMDTASDNSDVEDDVEQNMDTDDEDDYPLVRLNPASTDLFPMDVLQSQFHTKPNQLSFDESEDMCRRAVKEELFSSSEV